MKFSIVFSVGLWFMCYASQSFKCSLFSVYFGFMNVFPLVFKLLDQKTLKTLKTLFYFIVIIEIVLACSLVVWEQFLALTSLVPLSRTEFEKLFFFPWDTYHFTGFKR